MPDDQLELRWDPRPGDWGDALRAVTPIYRWSPWFATVLATFGAVLVVIGMPLPGFFGIGCALLIGTLPMVDVYLAFRRNPVAAATVTATADESSMRMMTIDGTAYTDLRWSTLEHNVSAGFQTVPGIFFLGRGAIDARHTIIRGP